MIDNTIHMNNIHNQDNDRVRYCNYICNGIAFAGGLGFLGVGIASKYDTAHPSPKIFSNVCIVFGVIICCLSLSILVNEFGRINDTNNENLSPLHSISNS